MPEYVTGSKLKSALIAISALLTGLIAGINDDEIKNLASISTPKPVCPETTTSPVTISTKEETKALEPSPAKDIDVIPIPSNEPSIAVPIDPKKLVKVREIRKYYMAANRADGKIIIRTGGNKSWRYNNPGKITHGDYTRSMGALGSDGIIAVFPTYEMGRKAMAKYLFTDTATYYNKSLKEIFQSEKLQPVLDETGISSGTILNDLTDAQKEKLMNAIQKAEGYIEGKETVFDDEQKFKTDGW